MNADSECEIVRMDMAILAMMVAYKDGTQSRSEPGGLGSAVSTL